jgi:hypothetical protein
MRFWRRTVRVAVCVIYGALVAGVLFAIRTAAASYRPDPGSSGQNDAGQGAVASEPQPGVRKDVAGKASPPKPRTFVTIVLEDPSSEKESLAKDVQKVLEHEQPENPGRKKTFGKMALRGLTSQNEKTHLLRQTGWVLNIQNVRRIPDGWQAEVVVLLLATRKNRFPITILNQHLETYSYRSGKLALTAQTGGPSPPVAGPDYDPSQGLVEDPITSALPKPEKVPPFAVETLLDGKATQEERGLAREVEAELRRKQPENPGRDQTFGKMVMVRRPPYGEPHEWKLKRLGWRLVIRRVERIPGGWRATVHVLVRAATVEGSDVLVSSWHLEDYSFRDGNLTRESDSVAPNWDPSQGLWPGHHGWPDPEEGRPLGNDSNQPRQPS